MSFPTEKGMMKMSNSSLVKYTKLSPNHSGARTHKIDRISPHCVVGQISIESLGNVFASKSRGASSNYGIGADGRIGMFVEEKNRSWCTSSNANDQRAVTIECASDSTHPYAFRGCVYDALVDLCVDICKRNGKKKLLWISNKTQALSYEPKSDEMILTVHRWFKNKACPGEWMMNHMEDLAKRVTKALSGGSSSSGSKTTGSLQVAQKKNEKFAKKYKVIADVLNIRLGAGTDFESIGKVTNGEFVRCYGYYNIDRNGVKWLMVQYGKITGYVSKNYLVEVK